MAKIKNPTTFAGHYGIDPADLSKAGVLNPTLGVDTKLFIDPLLLEQSAHFEISGDGVKQFRNHFESIIKLLGASKTRGDVAWRSSTGLFQFHEIPSTCLGYGSSSIRGSAFGPSLVGTVMETAKEIVDLGVTDPDLFVLLALFEEGIGPDRISDMTTNVVIDALVSFNARVLADLSVPTKTYTVKSKKVQLAENPLGSNEPVILVPTDILRQLPLATDWDGVVEAASANAALRARVNALVGELWSAKTKRDKRKLRAEVLSSKAAFTSLLEVVKKAKIEPYDAMSDPQGLLQWAEVGAIFAKDYPLQIPQPKDLSLDEVYLVVESIVGKFKDLVENNGLSKNLWRDGVNLPEEYAQRLFFAIAFGYCDANNLDISPEADSGRGPVDFKLSQGSTSKVLVEVKLSSNSKLVRGYTRQLEAYKAAEKTTRAIYLVLDVGRMGKKDQMLYKEQNAARASGEPVSKIEIVDAIPKPSASKL